MKEGWFLRINLIRHPFQYRVDQEEGIWDQRYVLWTCKVTYNIVCLIYSDLVVLLIHTYNILFYILLLNCVNKRKLGTIDVVVLAE